MANLTTKKSYLDTRLQEFGISEKDNATDILSFDENTQTYKDAKLLPTQWFKATDHDDIRILFKTITGRKMLLRHGTNKNVAETSRTCLSPENRAAYKERTGESMRYSQPKGTGSIIFHTPGIIDAFNAKVEVPTLYLVEGEFKAFVAWQNSVDFKLNSKTNIYKELMYPPTGLPIMGITGIFNFKDDEGGMHDDIRRFIIDCKVKQIVLIYDRDLFDLPAGYDPEEEKHQDKDVGKRISNFCTAALQFKEMYKAIISDIYLLPLYSRTPEHEAHKGLDDLIAAVGKQEVKQIMLELVKAPHDASRMSHFTGHNLIAKSTLDTKKFFKQKPKEFYDYHADVLDLHPFKFQGGKYQLDKDTGKLEMTAHPESFVYVRVQTKYYKMIRKPDNKGNQVRNILEWSKGNLDMDYVAKGYKNFFDTIGKYDSFVNIAINDPAKYQREIVSRDGTSKFYNLYEPIDHVPIQGDWSKIENYLRHIFGDQYIHALDYLYMTYMYPVVKMPVICLVSRERRTGKTKFLQLLNDIFQENAVTIGNAELGDRFNDDYASKLIIGVDEGLVEKSETTEKIKKWATDDKINMDKKNASRTSVDFLAHIVMNSNYPDTFMRISEDEDRFWVRYVKPFTGAEIPDLREQMVDQIPHLLYYLKNEHKRNTPESVSRFYFRREDLETEALNKLRDRSQSQLIRNLKLWIRDNFIEYNSHPDSDEFSQLNYTKSEIRTADDNWKKLDNAYIEEQLTLAGFPFGGKPQSCNVPVQKFDGNENEMQAYTIEYKTKRCFTFHISDFLTADEIANIKVAPPEKGEEGYLPF